MFLLRQASLSHVVSSSGLAGAQQTSEPARIHVPQTNVFDLCPARSPSVCGRPRTLFDFGFGILRLASTSAVYRKLAGNYGFRPPALIPRLRDPVSGDSSTASTPPGRPPALARGAAAARLAPRSIPSLGSFQSPPRESSNLSTRPVLRHAGLPEGHR